VQKVAGGDTGHGESPRWCPHQPQHGKLNFHF
jgi:hypothetical protein